MERQKLFLGNLSFGVTESDLRALCSQYGTVVAIRMRPKKGYAFVEMSTAAEAAAVIENLNQTEFQKRPLRISPELSPKKAKLLTKNRGKIHSKRPVKQRAKAVSDELSPAPSSDGHRGPRKPKERQWATGGERRTSRPPGREWAGDARRAAFRPPTRGEGAGDDPRRTFRPPARRQGAGDDPQRSFRPPGREGSRDGQRRTSRPPAREGARDSQRGASKPFSRPGAPKRRGGASKPAPRGGYRPS